MKKTAIILFLVLAIPALLTSCLFDEEDLFDKSASERIEAAKQEAKTVLESAENGWHVRYFPSPTQEFGGYNLFFKFSEGSVTVASEIETRPSPRRASIRSARIWASRSISIRKTRSSITSYTRKIPTTSDRPTRAWRATTNSR